MVRRIMFGAIVLLTWLAIVGDSAACQVVNPLPESPIVLPPLPDTFTPKDEQELFGRSLDGFSRITLQQLRTLLAPKQVEHGGSLSSLRGNAWRNFSNRNDVPGTVTLISFAVIPNQMLAKEVHSFLPKSSDAGTTVFPSSVFETRYALIRSRTMWVLATRYGGGEERGFLDVVIEQPRAGNTQTRFRFDDVHFLGMSTGLEGVQDPLLFWDRVEADVNSGNYETDAFSNGKTCELRLYRTGRPSEQGRRWIFEALNGVVLRYENRISNRDANVTTISYSNKNGTRFPIGYESVQVDIAAKKWTSRESVDYFNVELDEHLNETAFSITSLKLDERLKFVVDKRTGRAILVPRSQFED